MAKLRVISDVHGCIDNRKRLPYLPSYLELCSELGPDDSSIQLGDLGFNYKAIEQLDPKQHVVCLGNHDNYDVAHLYPHMLGDYGMVGLGGFDFFFVRGGFSIDKKARVRDEVLHGQKSWWSQEELNHQEGLAALEAYETFKPDVVFSHDCPSDISNLFGNPEILIAFGWPRNMVTSSQELMQQMLEIHSPKLWVFGHYHKNWDIKYHKTHFMCIAERQYIDFDENWEIIGRTGLTDRTSRV